jgi:hypothetical protein
VRAGLVEAAAVERELAEVVAAERDVGRSVGVVEGPLQRDGGVGGAAVDLRS